MKLSLSYEGLFDYQFHLLIYTMKVCKLFFIFQDETTMNPKESVMTKLIAASFISKILLISILLFFKLQNRNERSQFSITAAL